MGKLEFLSVGSLEASVRTDRRAVQRVQTRFRVVRLLTKGEEHDFSIRNISHGGAMGHTATTLVVGQLVRLRFEDGWVAAAAVRWTRGGRVGLGFLSLLPSSLVRPDSPIRAARPLHGPGSC